MVLDRLVAGYDDVAVFAHDLRGAADGLLHWRGDHRRFYLFYDRNPHRWRFNLAHEIGHYFIDDHCRHLRSPTQLHLSRSGFRSTDQFEMEADCFAGALLVPRTLLERLPKPDWADVEAIKKGFNTSWHCAAVRTVQLTERPAAIARCVDNQVRSWWPNEAFLALGLPGAADRWTVDASSAAVEAARTDRVTVRRTTAAAWGIPSGLPLLEACRYFSGDGFAYTLALVTPADGESP